MSLKIRKFIIFHEPKDYFFNFYRYGVQKKKCLFPISAVVRIAVSPQNM